MIPFFAIPRRIFLKIAVFVQDAKLRHSLFLPFENVYCFLFVSLFCVLQMKIKQLTVEHFLLTLL